MRTSAATMSLIEHGMEAIALCFDAQEAVRDGLTEQTMTTLIYQEEVLRETNGLIEDMRMREAAWQSGPRHTQLHCIAR